MYDFPRVHLFQSAHFVCVDRENWRLLEMITDSYWLIGDNMTVTQQGYTRSRSGQAMVAAQLGD